MNFDFRISLLTWNVKSLNPYEDLHKLFSVEGRTSDSLPDVYAVSLQEVAVNPLSLLVEDPWITAVIKLLSEYDFIKIKHVRLQGILLAIFSKKKHVTSIRDVETSYIRTGFGGYWGNKGAVSIRFSINHCSICIVNSHLAAHDHQLQQRINDYNAIIDNLKFTNKQTSRVILHDYVFWCGDLNFRLEELPATEIQELITKAKDAEDEKMKQHYIDELLCKDQLSIVRKDGSAFSEFSESTPSFLPTYRFRVKTDEYDFMSRRPAFTDRILYRVNPHVYNDVKLHMNQLEYASHYEYKQSDHKPVTSLFCVKVFTKPALNKLHLEEPINVTFRVLGNWCVYRDATVWYRVSRVRYCPQSEDNMLNERENYIRGISSFDWIAMYKSDFTSLDDYVCYTWASCNAHVRCPEMLQEIPSSSQSTETDSADAGERWFKVMFPDQSLLISGSYQLLYITQNGNVLGMSAPFYVESQ